MPTLESQIDELYKHPLAEFVAARTALAKTLSGDEAKTVKALAKPTVVPWAVNQLYWRARSVYDRLTKSGEKLRAAQLAALKGKSGKSADLPDAVAAHRQALGEAVAEATRLAAAARQQPAADTLGRMLEAISLTSRPPDHPGRFTLPLQPAGFEALAGVPIKATGKGQAQSKAALKLVAKERVAAERERAATERKWQASLKEAEAAAMRARTEEMRARKEWERRKDELERAEHVLSKLRDQDPEA